jgi:hypothetical protein
MTDKEKISEALAQTSFILEEVCQDIEKLSQEDLFVRYHTNHLSQALSQINKAYAWLEREIRKDNRAGVFQEDEK